MTPEEKSTERVRLRASSWGMRVFRNNSGVLMNPIGIPVRFGLGNESKRINKILKSSDLLGIHNVEITPEMVGKKIGVFTALEVKPNGFKIKEEYPEGSRELAQLNFINLIKKFGGMAGFATNEYDVDRILNDFLIGLNK
jgi:hypothetical protein